MTYLQPILPSVPLHRSSKMFDRLVNPSVPAKFFVVRTQDDFIFSCPISSYSVVGVRIRRVEIEDEQ